MLNLSRSVLGDGGELYHIHCCSIYLTGCETFLQTDFAQVDRADSPSQASLLGKHLAKQW